MPLKKKYARNKKTCTVTFVLPARSGVKSACIVGEFNNWDKDAEPMHLQEDGSLLAEITLDADQEYQYRFFVDGSTWMTDEDADDLVGRS